jgi:hypothetical protein
MNYNYYNIVFIQNDFEAEEPFQILNEKGEDALIEYLKQWDFGGESEHCMNGSVDKPWGSSDSIYRKGFYILSYNEQLGYVALTRKRKGVIPKEYR